MWNLYEKDTTYMKYNGIIGYKQRSTNSFPPALFIISLKNPITSSCFLPLVLPTHQPIHLYLLPNLQFTSSHSLPWGNYHPIVR